MRTRRRIIGLLTNERGIALPMALLALLVLSTLVIAFALLATSEPLVATNQKMVAQARAVFARPRRALPAPERSRSWAWTSQKEQLRG